MVIYQRTARPETSPLSGSIEVSTPVRRFLQALPVQGSMNPELKVLCDSYLEACFNEDDSNQIRFLLYAKNYPELEMRMSKRISFGTSGLRGKMQAGYSGINDLTIYQASLGLRDYVLDKVPQAKTRGIVLGYDHRHNSQRYAQIVEAVFAPAMKVYVFRQLVHTPLVPFGVKHLNAACGVMITASHNPKDDNGYKVYWSNACAIIPPHDHGIADAIVKAANTVTKPEFGLEYDSVENVYQPITKAYYERLFATTSQQEDLPGPDFRFCYTPMHGVGLLYARVAMSAAPSIGAKAEMVVVAEQALPDPDFSTVAYPNPEEPGALDQAMATADEEGITLVVATDPDADRLGAAEKHDGKWRILTGNQIGVLLASELLRTRNSSRKRALLSSTVSSKMFEAIAKVEQLHWEETLTGFKWLGNRALTLREEGYDVVLAYEEALGFMPYDIVYDKDGILSMTVLLRLARRLHSQGQNLSFELLRLYNKYGFFASANSYFPISESRVTETMALLRTPAYPKSLGDCKVSRVRDLTTGYDSATEDHIPALPVSKTSEMITFWFEPSLQGACQSATMTIRASGTEPKLKYYIEAQASTLIAAEAAAKSIEQDLEKLWFAEANLSKAD